MTDKGDITRIQEPKDFLQRCGYKQEVSTIDPPPPFPNLVRQVRGPTNAMVLTYIEMIYPCPQDANGAVLDRAVTIDCDQACRDIQVSRRTLHVALRCLGAWYLTEGDLGRAERAGRAFINADHSLHGPVKIYSIVGSKCFSQPHSILSVKRNWPRLNAIFASTKLAFLQYPFVSTPFGANHVPMNDDTGATSRCASILARVMPDWGDRRAERWDRWGGGSGKKTRNPGRMRDTKKLMSSCDSGVNGAHIIDTDASEVDCCA